MQIQSDTKVKLIQPRSSSDEQSLGNTCTAEFTQASGVIITGVFPKLCEAFRTRFCN